MSDDSDRDMAKAALLKAIAEARASDPLIAAKIAGQQVLHNLMAGLKDERGVHVETLLTGLGALAGFACQMGVRANARLAGVAPPFTVVSSVDGRRFYFGDAINGPLLEDRYSVWSLCAGAAQHLGAELPDVMEIVEHVAHTVGRSDFGESRFPGQGQAKDKPAAYVRHAWPWVVQILVELGVEPAQWHVALALAAQEAVILAKAAIPPTWAVQIVMEAAVPMSKVDPAEVGLLA